VTTLGGAAAGLASGAAPKRRRWAVAVGALVVAGGATTAIALAGAGLIGALANVQINLDSLAQESAEDTAFIAETRKRAEALKTAQ